MCENQVILNRKFSLIKIVLTAVLAGLWMATAISQDQSDRVWVLPLEIDSDFGADNGNAIISRAIPVNSLLVREDWKLINLAMITIADAPGGLPGSPGNPDPVAGPKTFGLGDLTDAVLFTWNTKGKLMLGAGAAFNLPIATDETLGSGKWQAGPAIRVAYQALNWRFGLLATNRWSFAGDSDRADVNQLLLRTVIRRELVTGGSLSPTPSSRLTGTQIRARSGWYHSVAALAGQFPVNACL